ncbi:retrovirus-related Pol polyprotein from transposon 412 [Trichonephila clavipes]|nr:retrovirus-related Pol polyprotein from transposon 412 [Trichonephila clavipes]
MLSTRLTSEIIRWQQQHPGWDGLLLSGLKTILFPTKRPRCCGGSSSTIDLKIRSSSTNALRSREKLRFCSLQEIVSVLHETTGYSPPQMLFGRDFRLPADFLFSRPPDVPLAPEKYVEKLQTRMEEMHHLARERIGMASEKRKTRYDAIANGVDFHEGDKV